MLNRWLWKRPITIAALLCSNLLIWGCASSSEEKLVAPRTLVSPYDTSRGEVLWAVVPLRNESGTTVVDAGAVSDKVVAAVEEVEGIRAVPLNRTIQAMNVLGLTSLRTPSDARSLASAMGVDGVLVGSITAYDPYTPSIGLSLALYARPGAMAQGRHPLDPRSLTAKSTDAPAAIWSREEGPVASVSDHLDAKNHQVQMDVQAFSQGRTKGPTALGWKRYLASADLFSEFAAYHAIDGLMNQEWTRLPGSAAAGARAAGVEEGR